MPPKISSEFSIPQTILDKFPSDQVQNVIPEIKTFDDGEFGINAVLVDENNQVVQSEIACIKPCSFVFEE